MKHGAKQNGGLQARQGVADAEVASVAKGEMRVGMPGDVEVVRLIEHSLVSHTA